MLQEKNFDYKIEIEKINNISKILMSQAIIKIKIS
jgi:hypothetical protein